MTSTEEHTGWPFAIEKAARAAIPSGATPAALVAVLLMQARQHLDAECSRSADSNDLIRTDLVKVTRLLIGELATLADKLEQGITETDAAHPTFITAQERDWVEMLRVLWPGPHPEV